MSVTIHKVEIQQKKGKNFEQRPINDFLNISCYATGLLRWYKIEVYTNNICIELGKIRTNIVVIELACRGIEKSHIVVNYSVIFIY